MNTMIKSKRIPFELEDGTKVELTLNFRRLMNVRNKRKDIYDKYNKIMMDGPKDVFDNIVVLYTAYLCGLEDVETAISYDTFIDNLPPYMGVINNTVVDLTLPKKQTASAKPSEAESEQGKEE